MHEINFVWHGDGNNSLQIMLKATHLFLFVFLYMLKNFVYCKTGKKTPTNKKGLKNPREIVFTDLNNSLTISKHANKRR